MKLTKLIWSWKQKMILMILIWKFQKKFLKNNNDYRNIQTYLNILNFDKIDEINLIVKTKINVDDIIWNFKKNV